MAKLLSRPAIMRFFSNDKTIKSRAYNRFGAQLARTMLARAVYRVRKAETPQWLHDDVEILERDGLLVIPDFLPQATFEKVAQRATDLFQRERARTYQVHTGRVTLHVLNQKEISLSAELPEFFENPRLCGIMQAVERRRNAFKNVHQAIELLEQREEGGPDSETMMHSDTFYTMHKAWLYLSDVALDSPPLTYVKGSHLLTRVSLVNIYRESCAQNGGTRRITAEELEKSQLEETIVTCRRNTLAIANTFGYHRRLPGKPGETRFALHMALRDTMPFNRSA